LPPTAERSYLQHSFWFLPDVAACHAMANLLAEKQNVFWPDYDAIVAAGSTAGIGLEALPPAREAIGSGFNTKTITLSCGKLITGVTGPQRSSILMLRNLKSPETYSQAAFRVQSPWSIKNPNGDEPKEEEILKAPEQMGDHVPELGGLALPLFKTRPAARTPVIGSAPPAVDGFTTPSTSQP